MGGLEKQVLQKADLLFKLYQPSLNNNLRYSELHHRGDSA